MIVIGYQGIGKSSLAGRDSGCIDLESGNFWHDGVRPDDWYIYYCNIAEHLSKQGFTVFTSSHEVVRNYLKENCKEDVYVIFPSLALKDEWIKKLKDRYRQTGLDKDYKALKNAEDRYEENIEELKNSGFTYCEIDSMDYNLKNILVDILSDMMCK